MKFTVNISDFVASVIRTLVPMIVGWAVGLPVTPQILHAIGWSTSQANLTLSTALSFGLSFVYYLAVRGLEKLHPSWGVLLGVPAQPTYIDQSGAHVAPPAVEPQTVTAPTLSTAPLTTSGGVSTAPLPAATVAPPVPPSA